MNAIRFEYDLIGNLTDLALSLQKGTYRPSRSVCFITTTPKLREVFAADFRDRIVHHLIVRELEKIWEPCFIADSYACRQGKGTHKAVTRLQSFMLKASKSQKHRAWFMQLDIRSFFMSIDKRILFQLLQKKTDSPVLLDLIARVVFHDPTQDYFFKGEHHLLEKIPPHKSLFKIPAGKGLPIGNLTSQFFANVYLNELDQFVKHTLHCRFYLRYVDDFIILADSEAQLVQWQQNIIDFLRQCLLLELKAEPILKPVSAGADFLGYIVRPDYILSRRRVVNNLKYKLALCRDKIIQSVKIREGVVIKMTLTPEIMAEVRQILASYLGHFKHANTHHLIQNLFKNNQWLDRIFFLMHGKLLERLRYHGTCRSFFLQAAFFRCRFPDYVQFFRIGKFIEAFNEDALWLNRITGIKLQTNVRGMNQSAGFPLSMKQRFITLTLMAKRNVVFIDEGGMGKYIRERYAGEIWEPA